MHWRRWISQHSPFISLLALGILLRLLAALFLTHTFDFFNILALAKSVADTGNLSDGFFATGPLQLYGKIYYQITAIWLYFLNAIHLIDLRYLFDVKAFGQGSYMQQFPYLGPEIYQIAAIKLIQFAYDFLLLFFLIKIARTLKLANTLPLVLFWAVNPLIIYVGYVIFQSDLAMITFLTGGTYFLLKGVTSQSLRKSTINNGLSLVFFAIGGVIKQVPLLAVPVTLLLSRSLRQFSIGIGVFLLSYFLFYQPWSPDASLMKSFFLTSPESTALFNFKFNGITVFFALYLSFLAIIVLLRQRIKDTPIFIIHLITLLLAIIYVSEDPAALFVQFNLWVMPFLAILALYDKNYSLFFIAPLLGFYRRALVDQSILSGTLAAILGEPINKAPSYEETIRNFMQPDIVLGFMSTLVTMLYILLIIYLLFQLVKGVTLPAIKQLNDKIKLNVIKASLGIFFLFTIIAFAEFLFMSRYALLTNYAYSDSREVLLSRSPVTFAISNPKHTPLTGIALKLKAKNVNGNDQTIVKVLDRDTKKVLIEKSVNDYMIPIKSDEYFTITFPHSVNAATLQIQVLKEKGLNNIAVYEATKFTATPTTRLSVKYDNYYKNSPLKLAFSGSPIEVNLRGQYTLEAMLHNISYHFAKKPTFFFSYFLCLLFLAGVSFILLPKTLHSLKSDLQ